MGGVPVTDDARTHAVTASQLLGNADEFSRALQTQTAEQRLHMIASGGVERANADLDYTIRVATAHALAAIALHMTEDGSDG